MANSGRNGRLGPKRLHTGSSLGFSRKTHRRISLVKGILTLPNFVAAAVDQTRIPTSGVSSPSSRSF